MSRYGIEENELSQPAQPQQLSKLPASLDHDRPKIASA